MSKTKSYLLLILVAGLLSSCKYKKADILMTNGIIHSLDAEGSVFQALAIADGKVIATGSTEDLKFEFQADTIMDLEGRSVFPGFIDAHCHFVNYALQSSYRLDVVGTRSWAEVLVAVDSFASKSPTEWITGRGWDQNDWEVKEYPTNDALNKRFPNRPVMITRIDGHAAIANAEALRRAGITGETVVKGGKIITKRGKPTGLLIDNAIDLVSKKIPPYSTELITQALLKAQKDMFAVGLTTVDDAGLDKDMIFLIDSLQQAGLLKLRVYAMANPTEENMDHFFKSGPLKTDKLHVCSFKIYADGSLGSRGACMLKSYRDKPGQVGFLLESKGYYREMANKLYKNGFQMNTHCIGDSANRMMLRIYGNVLGEENDLRWRIEHAQVVDTNDFVRFGKYNIWPSVQPTHATSDMYWAEDRIGKARLKGAYAYNTLFQQRGKIAFGSDFPVEGINPMLGFYAAVARKDLLDFPYNGFQMQDSVTRMVALKAMTIWAAEANFEEKEKGSIEAGKVADLVIMKDDILFMEKKKLPYARIEKTIVNGEIVFKQ